MQILTAQNPLVVRSLMLFCVAFFIVGATEGSIQQAVVIFGQAHFLLAYLYHFKTGKMNYAYLVRYMFAFVFLFGAYHLYGPSNLPNFLVYCYFTFHFCYDERYLMSESTSFEGWLRLSPLIVVCLSCLPLGEYFYELGKSLSLLLLGMYITSRFITKKAATVQDVYFLIAFVVCYFLAYTSYAPSRIQVINFIILVHFANWYFNYFVKFKANPAAFRQLSFEVLICNALLLVLYYFYFALSTEPASALSGLQYFFGGDYFALWSLLHYFVTFRPADLGNWLPDTFKTRSLRGNL